MALKLMYITNRPEIARIAESAGVDRIFVDLEYIGKDVRQGGLDTVQSHHTLNDIVDIKKTIKTSELLVRCNPIHDKCDEYSSSEEEIEAVIKDGADIVMLPYFKTVAEVKRFIGCVGGRVKTMLLVETPEAVSVIDDILEINGIDEVFIGLNDLSLGYGKKFMFELPFRELIITSGFLSSMSLIMLVKSESPRGMYSSPQTSPLSEASCAFMILFAVLGKM